MVPLWPKVQSPCDIHIVGQTATIFTDRLIRGGLSHAYTADGMCTFYKTILGAVLEGVV